MVEDWTGDKAFDSLRTNLRGSNPGVVTAGHPNMLGKVHAMKPSKARSSSICFMVKKSISVDDILRTTPTFSVCEGLQLSGLGGSTPH